MRAAYYEQNGRAAGVLRVGEIDTPVPGPGEVRVKLKTSGINPSDVKGRAGLTRKIAFARVVPHSDGAGEIDVVGAGVPQARVGERVWTFNAQWKRASGTAAEYVVLPSHQAVALPTSVNFDARRRHRHSSDDGVVRGRPRAPGRGRHGLHSGRRRRCRQLRDSIR